MQNLEKGTECIRLLLSQTSKDMHEPLVPMLFPILGVHVCDAEFQYPDLSWKELCGQMANLIAENGVENGQFGGRNGVEIPPSRASACTLPERTRVPSPRLQKRDGKVTSCMGADYSRKAMK